VLLTLVFVANFSATNNKDCCSLLLFAHLITSVQIDHHYHHHYGHVSYSLVLGTSSLNSKQIRALAKYQNLIFVSSFYENEHRNALVLDGKVNYIKIYTYFTVYTHCSTFSSSEVCVCISCSMEIFAT